MDITNPTSIYSIGICQVEGYIVPQDGSMIVGTLIKSIKGDSIAKVEKIEGELCHIKMTKPFNVFQILNMYPTQLTYEFLGNLKFKNEC